MNEQKVQALNESQPKLEVGQQVRIKDHVRFQQLVRGAVISPMKEHQIAGGQITIIRAIYQDRFEDEHGNAVYECCIDTPFGQFSSDELEIV